MEPLLWLFVGILIIIGIIIIFSSQGADRDLAIISYILSLIPFGGAVYFILIAFHIKIF